MTRDEAHALLDAVRDGTAACTSAQMREALLATGDLQREPLTQEAPQRSWAYHMLEAA
jgi:hypothetical protein